VYVHEGLVQTNLPLLSNSSISYSSSYSIGGPAVTPPIALQHSRSFVLLTPLQFPHSSPEALHTRQRERPVSEGRKYGREMAGQILPDNPTSTKFLGSLTCRKAAAWDRRLHFPSEGRHAEDFYARKIRRLRPGLNPRT
jgi:hypothetical protein